MTLQIYCFYQDNKLVAFFPLYLGDASKSIAKAFKCLRFIGTGEDDNEEVSTEYSDIICLAAYEHDVVSFIAHCYETNKYNWHVLILEKVLESSLIVKILSNPGDNIKSSKFCIGKRYYLDIEDGWDAYQKSLAKKLRRRANYYVRRLENSNEIKFSLTENLDQINIDFKVLKALHENRWGNKGERGAFSSEKFIKFHNRQMKLLMSSNDLFLHKLIMGNDVFAALYSFRFKDTMYYYQSGFDHENFKKYSPGLVLIMKSIQTAVSNNCNIYDFMMGDFDSYKKKYGCVTEDMYDIKIYNSNLLSKILFLLVSLKQKCTGVFHKFIDTK